MSSHKVLLTFVQVGQTDQDQGSCQAVATRGSAVSDAGADDSAWLRAQLAAVQMENVQLHMKLQEMKELLAAVQLETAVQQVPAH